MRTFDVKASIEDSGKYVVGLEHIVGDQTCSLENTSGSEAIYVISGGHSDTGHH